MSFFKIILFLMIGVPFSSFSQSIVIGNSGDGYLLRNNEVWVRDFLVYNINESDNVLPTVPENELTLIVHRLNQVFNNDFSINSYNLALRIKALELIHPALPSVFVEAIASYNWILIDSELNSIFPREDYFYISGVHVQIAIRHLNNITISKKAWNKMSDFNKNALVIHEAIYSMIQVSYNPLHKHYYQSSRRTRETVGILFSTHFQPDESTQKKLLNIFKNELNIPFEEISRNQISKNPISIEPELYEAVYGPEIRLRIKLDRD